MKGSGFMWRSISDDPAMKWAKQIVGTFEKEDSAAGPVRTLADMSDEEIEALENFYGCQVVKNKTGS